MDIDKKVPAPSRRGFYKWRDMQVGDSIFFDDQPKKSQSNPSISARCFGYANDKQFRARSEGNGVRIWRVA
jgi:hypothetical protein